MEQKKVSNAVLVLSVAIFFFALGYLSHMIFTQKVQGIIDEIEREEVRPQEVVTSVNREGTQDLEFSYEDESFKLEEVEFDGVISYQVTIDEGTSTMHGFTFLPSKKSYIKGNLEGEEVELFVVWRGSGANIIEGVLFAFKDDEQLDYVNLPEDGGRTSIDKLSIKDGLVVLEVKTSGPDKNYHETYLPRTYAYKLSEGKLLLQ